MKKKFPDQNFQNAKQEDLNANKSDANNQFLTTNQGVKINDDNNSLIQGQRGPTLLEDFIFREKMTHFDHERIPERIVHARGSGAHGYFEVTNPIPQFTKAGFLQTKGQRTPVFARFSTVQGSRGSTDLPRDVRGFAVKFYTQEGIYDLVSNNMPVFFIQDANKFPDLVHAVKPEPHNEIPQAASAHDTFWDFISLMPESAHMIMWLMSDRAIPRSYRMMEGFGVHTFRFINDQNQSHFVKFHWKPKLGTHAVLWDEAQKISGRNPDFHRLDLWEAIEAGHFPEWELGVQIIPENQEHAFDFDLLDPTKLIPEEIIPITIIGKMVLNKNPDNFFAETEQVAFHPGHVVPGIDFTNDPLLQGRLFSYTDTQLFRLGSPNFHEIPINRTLNAMHNNQRDGYMRQEVNIGKVNYHPNSLGGGCPFQAMMSEGGFTTHNERVEGHKIRQRSDSFRDHFSQAKLFYESQTPIEQQHIINAFCFELGKVEAVEIRVRMLGIINKINNELAQKVGEGLGIEVPSKPMCPINHGVGADDWGKHEPIDQNHTYEKSQSLSMIINPTVKPTIASRKIAFLCHDNINEDSVLKMKINLLEEDAVCCIVAPHLGFITTIKGGQIPVDFSLSTASSVLFDAVFLPDGMNQNKLSQNIEAMEFVNDAYRHCKVIGADGDGVDILSAPAFLAKGDDLKDKGIITGTLNDDDKFIGRFIKAMKNHRYWERENQLNNSK